MRRPTGFLLLLTTLCLPLWLSVGAELETDVDAPYRAEYVETSYLGLAWGKSVSHLAGRHTPIHVFREGDHVTIYPLFLVLGAQKGGSTSLRFNLLRHPKLGGSLREVHFFDKRFPDDATPPLPPWAAALLLKRYTNLFNYEKGLNATALVDSGRFVMDSSPRYLFHVETPYRVRMLLPHVRMIVLLRAPEARYLSELHMYLCRGYGMREFHEPGKAGAYVAEATANYTAYDPRCRGPEASGADLRRCQEAANRFQPLIRGLYADQLERWYSLFPRSQIMVIDSNELFTNFEGVLRQVTDFVGLPSYKFKYDASHQSPDMRCSKRSKVQERYERTKAIMEEANDERVLRKFYRPHNERLFKLLGRDLGWNDEGEDEE